MHYDWQDSFGYLQFFLKKDKKSLKSFLKKTNFCSHYRIKEYISSGYMS